MADKKKQEYYKNNKRKRLEYQRKYYEKNKGRILTSRERKRAEDPEWAKEQKNYNKDYYTKNKERIMAKRRARKELIANRSWIRAQESGISANKELNRIKMSVMPLYIQFYGNYKNKLFYGKSIIEKFF